MSAPSTWHRSGLWSQITALLRTEPPLTTRQIAERLDADLTGVRRLLMIYAERGRTVRVIYRDRKHVHWRMAERDPRRDPRPGDVLRRRRITRHVARIQLTAAGALFRIHGTENELWTAIGWRTWANDGARVLKRGEA